MYYTRRHNVVCLVWGERVKKIIEEYCRNTVHGYSVLTVGFLRGNVQWFVYSFAQTIIINTSTISAGF